MQRQRFTQDWRFHLGDPEWWQWNPSNLSTWRRVDLPHDWSIELDRHPDHPCGTSGGYFAMGRGWYGKSFTAPEAWRGKKVYLEFEGVYMNAESWLNHQRLGYHPYGYTTFCYDLTPHLKIGSDDNSLGMRVDNSWQRNSRWYSGSGIYRPVWLLVAHPVHVSHWGVSVTTPQVSAEEATVRLCTTVENGSESACQVSIRSCIIAPDGALVCASEAPTAIDVDTKVDTVQELEVPCPHLWSPDTPHLYRLETEVVLDGQIVDRSTTPFGIRSLSFDAQSGFQLNGKPLLLKGGCVHHDNGVLGAASYERSEARKVELLKASGYNAIRCAHNPPAPAFLDACDRLGMLVIDEAFDCWREGKNAGDYHVSFEAWWQRDLESMLLRDRNHPSVIMWSIGNEVAERGGRSDGRRLARELADYVRAVDPTRPVTSGVNGLGSDQDWAESDAIHDALDVSGYNYLERQYRSDHERVPERVIYGAESTASKAYDHWTSVLELDHVIGDFVWTSLDYLGESGIGRVRVDEKEWRFLGEYPWHQANCGDLDLCGFKRPQSAYRDILWDTGSKLYLAVHPPVPAEQTSTAYPEWVKGMPDWSWPDVWPDWTWPGREGDTFQVDVYSAYKQVELFLNDRSLGIQPAGTEQKHTATFQVPYEPGILSAVGRTEGKEETCTLQTVGAPDHIRLHADRNPIRAEYGDLCYVTVEIVDEDGRVHPNAENNVLFTVKGPGTLVAVGSGNPVSTEPYLGNQRKVHRGRCLAVIRADGTAGAIVLRAQADGLDGAEVAIDVR